MSDLAHRDHIGGSLEGFQPDRDRAMMALGFHPNNPLTHAAKLLAITYGLDPVLGHIKILPGKGNQPATIWITRDGYLFKALEHPEWGGLDLVEEDDGGGPPDGTYFCRVVCRRKGKPDAEGRAWYKWKQAKGQGGHYIDENADEMCLQRAERRALRRQFPLSIFEAGVPVEDGEPQPAPEPVVEVARMVDEMSGASERGQSPGAPVHRRDDPAPDPTSGAETASTARSGGHSAPSRVSAPDSTSDPGGLSPRDPGSDVTSGERHEFVGRLDRWCERCNRPDRDPIHTSPSPADPGKVAGGGDSNPPDNASEAGEAIPSDDEGEGSDGSGEHPATTAGAKERDGTAATTDLTPPADPSPVGEWCEAHDIDIRWATPWLKRVHGADFPQVKDRADLLELRGEDAAKAVRYLDVWLHQREEADNTP